MENINKEQEEKIQERDKLELSEAVMEAEKKILENPDSGDLWMERGLALAAQKLFRDAADSYSHAISLDPFKGIYYRHRGHRFISCYCFEDACADFVVASRLIPLNWDVWYHLGLSHFLLGQYDKAERAYRRCYELSKEEEKLTAVSNWYWITLQRLGKKDEAQYILNIITEKTDPGENVAYFNLLKMYKGILKPEALLDLAQNDTDFITMGFGIANYFDHIGNSEKCDEIINETLERGDKTESHYAFGYIAAMVERQIRSLKAMEPK